MFCSNCGAKNNDDAKFCSDCGTTLASNVENEKKGEIVNNSEETISVIENSNSGIEKMPVNNPEPINKETSKSSKSYKKFIGFGALLIVLLGIGFFAITSGLFSNKAMNPVIYLKDNELLVRDENQESSISITTSLFEDEELLNGEGIFGAHPYNLSAYELTLLTPQVTDNGMHMFFFNDIEYDDNGYIVAELYYRNTDSEEIKDKGADDIGIKLASDVLPFIEISKDGKKVAYIREVDESSGNLYVHNLTEEIRISTEVDWTFSLSEDGNTILYSSTNSDEYYDYYLKSIAEDSVKEKVDEDIITILYKSPDLSKIYYSKHDSEEKDSIAVYLKEAGKDSTKIVGDINDVIDVDESGNIVYVKSYEEAIGFDSLVDDDLASSDATLTEPYIDDFITSYDYSFDYYYYDYYYTPVYDYDAYYAAVDQYTAKTDRDYIREELKNNPITVTKNDLYIYSENNSNKISSDIGEVHQASSSDRKVVFSKAIEGDFKKLKISQMSSPYEAVENYWSGFGTEQNLYLYTFGNKPNEVLSKHELYSITITDDFKTIYCIEDYNDDMTKGTLAKYSIGEEINREVIADDVSRYNIFNGSDILMIKDENGLVGNLYLKLGDKIERISDKVLSYDNLIDEDANTIISLEDYNEEKGRGRLVKLTGFEKTVIAEDVNSYYYRNPDSILYMTDYSESKYNGELWLHNGEAEAIKIDNDVSTILAY